MKKTLLFALLGLFSFTINAQDACEDLKRFNNYEKNVNRAYRMTMNNATIGQKLIMEKDQKGNMRQVITMAFMGNNTHIETITTGDMLYTKKNDEAWDAKQLDSVQLNSVKDQWKSNQLSFFKNCEKITDETFDGKTYRTYKADMDLEKMQEMLNKSGQGAESLEAMKQMDIKLIFYVNDKDDVAKAKIKVQMMGQTLDTDTVFEYDMDIPTIMPPPPPPPVKKR